MEKIFIYAGIILFSIGLILKYAPWLINWFGHLPGDILYTKANSTIFIPITSMIVVSIILTVLLKIFFD